jgi:UDP-GlcNAc:undecaprenyl-phosphate GlcNAc-1-phosphate transferase
MPSDLSVLVTRLAPFGGALVISWLLTALLIRLAPRLGLVDYPAARKVHTKPTPKGGGLAIYVAVAAVSGLLAATRSPDRALVSVALGLVLVVLGLVDDVRSLPWQLRLAVQFTVAVVAVYAFPPSGSWGDRAATVFWVVGLTNAFNMLDNMDALSAGVAWVVAAILVLVVLGSHGDPDRAQPLLILMGALFGFLWFNRPPARIFMGDAGSTFLGFFLSVESLAVASESPEQPCLWAMPMCVLALPWYDLVTVVLIRLSQGRSPFHADKQHLSHRLVELGLRPPTAVRVIYLLALASGLGGLVVYQLGRGGMAALVGVQVVAWWVAIAGIELGARQTRNTKKEG